VVAEWFGQRLRINLGNRGEQLDRDLQVVLVSAFGQGQVAAPVKPGQRLHHIQ
jgi:hypothetical protein